MPDRNFQINKRKMCKYRKYIHIYLNKIRQLPDLNMRVTDYNLVCIGELN